MNTDEIIGIYTEPLFPMHITDYKWCVYRQLMQLVLLLVSIIVLLVGFDI